MTITCAIIEDEPLARDLLKSYVKKTSFLNLAGSYDSAISAIRELTAQPVQLLFLDIQMPDMNGIDFSRMLPFSTKVIFTTAFQQYAVEGFRVGALDYLMKPINYTEFLESANKALAWHQAREEVTPARKKVADEEFIYVKADYKLLQVKFDDILYIEGLKDYLRIHIRGQEEPILTLVSMKSMEERLPSPRFLRVHRSYIVQTSMIKIIEKGQILFDEIRIPVSDGYRPELQKFINSHTL